MLFGAVRQLATDFLLDGERVRVTMPAPDGSDACLWALSDDWRHLFPRALEADQREYWEERLADPDDLLDRGMLRPVAFALARQVFGVDWWVAHRITTEAAESYLAYEGWCCKHGFRPDGGEPAHRIIASIMAWKSEGWSDEADAKSWWQRMTMPPPGVN